MPDFDHEIIDPHIHLFDVHGTPRPTQQFVRLFGWNERLLRAMLKRMFPKPTVSFFGERTSLVNDYLTSEYRADSVTSEVGRYVHVQAGWKDKTPMDAVGETEWLESPADPPAAIVEHADLQQAIIDDVKPLRTPTHVQADAPEASATCWRTTAPMASWTSQKKPR